MGNFNSKLQELLKELGISEESLNSILEPSEDITDEQKIANYNTIRAMYVLSLAASTAISARAAGLHRAIAEKKQNRVRTDWVLDCLIRTVIKPSADLLDLYVTANADDEAIGAMGLQILRGHHETAKGHKA